ncbi:MAG: helix-hairpin-helix domain-containing protein [Polaribacter sp.]|nr:helix-hairpin-helix domain-containing protein [Polaribacter sp.]
MKYLKPHFWYAKSQRNGVLFLILLIIGLQTLYVFVDFSSDKNTGVTHQTLVAFQQQIDSLKSIELERRKPKIYPFNPNYISDYKGAQLGLSLKEIDRLHAFRNTKKFINSTKEFQQVTQVSDTLLGKIAPYFKFPDWVTKQQQALKAKKTHASSSIQESSYGRNYSITTTNINEASSQDFQTIAGVEDHLAERILKYRKRLQGFSFASQLYEVWQLDPKIAAQILMQFKINNTPKIQKINVNTATFKEVMSNPYIDYELCKKIFEYRDEVAELQSIEELKNIVKFPLDKYKRIILYLEAK